MYRYTNASNLPDGKYVAVLGNDNIARITERETTKIDKTTYSDASGKISYEVSAWRIVIKNGKIRKV
jgi:hypothetical protein